MAHKAHYVDGNRVPSVTTITSRFGDKGGLIFWANAVGLGERDCDDQEPCKHCGRRPGKKQYEASRKAREVGDLGHALIEARVKGHEIDETQFAHFDHEQRAMAADCLEAFERWYKNSGVDIVETELPITNAEYGFGGTFDAVGHVDGRFALIDWKTSKGIYDDYIAQLAGYVVLVEGEGFPHVEQVDILRFSKETAAFEHRSFPRRTFQPAIDFFLKARELYELEKGLKKLMR